MDEKVRKEVDAILAMVARWKVSWFEEYRDPEEFPEIEDPNAWVLDEFTQLIHGGDFYPEGMVAPYLRRLLQTELITHLEYEGIVERIYGEVEDMRRLLGLSEPERAIPIKGDK